MPEDNEARYLCEINLRAIKNSVEDVCGALYFRRSQLILVGLVYLLFFSGSKKLMARSGVMDQSAPWRDVRKNLDRILETNEVLNEACSNLLSGTCASPGPTRRPESGTQVEYEPPALNRLLRKNQDERLIPQNGMLRKQSGARVSRDSERQLMKFYESCLNREIITTQSRQSFLEELRSIGLSRSSGPVLPILAKISLIYGMHNPVLNSFIAHSSNHGINYIHFSPYNVQSQTILEPSPAEPRFNVSSEIIERIGAVLGQISKSFEAIDFKRVSLEELFVQKNFMEVDSEIQSQFAKLNEYITARLKEISSIIRKGPVSKTATFHLPDLMKQHKGWHDLMNGSIDSYINSGQRGLVVVDSPDETLHLLNTVENSEELGEVIRMYTVVLFIDMIHRNADQNHHRATEDAAINKSGQEGFCSRQARRFFPLTFGAMLSRELLGLIAKDEVRMIIRMLLLAIKLILDDSSISKIPGFEDIGSEIADTTLLLGHSSHVDSLNTTEHEIDIQSEYLTNVLRILGSRGDKMLSLLGTPRSIRDGWPLLSSDETSVYYGSGERVLVIPSEWLMYPYHVEGTMYLTTLGALGFVVSQRIFHSIYKRLEISNRLDSQASLFLCLSRKFETMSHHFAEHKLLEYAFVKNFAFQAVLRAADLLKGESFDWNVEGSDEADWREIVIISMAFPHCDYPSKAMDPVIQQEMNLRSMDFSIFMDQGPSDSHRFDPWNCSTTSGSRCLI